MEPARVSPNPFTINVMIIDPNTRQASPFITVPHSTSSLKIDDTEITRYCKTLAIDTIEAQELICTSHVSHVMPMDTEKTFGENVFTMALAIYANPTMMAESLLMSLFPKSSAEIDQETWELNCRSAGSFITKKNDVQYEEEKQRLYLLYYKLLRNTRSMCGMICVFAKISQFRLSSDPDKINSKLIGDNMVVYVEAIREIKKGEHITISYARNIDKNKPSEYVPRICGMCQDSETCGY